KVLNVAHQKKLLNQNPVLYLKSKKHRVRKKHNLKRSEWDILLKADCPIPEVKRAAIVSLYTGLLWCDISKLNWENITFDNVIELKQSKTGEMVETPLMSSEVIDI